ncbi:Uncharacterised protein [Brevibacterium iodinum]|uniref:hypothetical protein n=1 Tax=Brevibacterium iodinum TaxID=31943 RepID=UPI000E128BB1|nr:Uncharacterised protein [Brevibacterium iodinum]SUW13281.1 Uncharacterised protein [Brevibacterium iodinum]
MSIVAHLYNFFIGVDTHARKHVYTIITNTGILVATGSFPTSRAGIKRALTWAGRWTKGTAEGLVDFTTG